MQGTEEALLHISSLKFRKASGALETPNSRAISTRSLVFVTSYEIANLQKAVAKKTTARGLEITIVLAKQNPRPQIDTSQVSASFSIPIP